MSIELKKIKSTSRQKKPESDQFLNSILNILTKDIQLGKKKLNDRKKEIFYSELGILLISGIDIKSSLEIMVEEQAKHKDKELFLKISNDVISGKSLSESLETSGQFTPYEIYSIKIGEESGRINEVLSELSSFYRKKIKQQRQLVSALSYPVMVFLTALLSVIFMLSFIVPMFTDVFKRFGGKLPALTQWIIECSHFVKSNIIYLVIFIIALIIFYLSVRSKEAFRRYASNITLKVPVLGKVINKIYLARFCHAMGLLIGARTPLLSSIQLVQKMINFYPYETALKTIDNDVLHGKSLFESMSAFTIFEKRVVSLIKVAEETNQLDTIFNKLNNQYSEEVDHQIGMLSNFLEPILIVFVGIMVALILIAMYLPLFQISSSIY